MLSPLKLSRKDTAVPADSPNKSHVLPAMLKKFITDDKHCNWHYAYDDRTGVIDFCSKKLAVSKKCLERTVSFRISGNGTLQFVSAFYDGVEVPEAWIETEMENIMDENSKTDLNTEKSQAVNTTAVITPSESLRDDNATRKRKAFTMESTSSVSLNRLHVDDIQKFLSVFFSANLEEVVEVPVKKETSTKAPTTSRDLDAARTVTASLATAPATTTTATGEAPALEVKPILISIEGNIGAGKSYLLTKLRAAHPEWCFIDEPVDFWESLRNNENESLLQVFYKDQRWSYTFQNCALLSRFNNIETTILDKTTKLLAEAADTTTTTTTAPSKAKVLPQIFVTERCLDTDHEVFAKMLHADGQLDALEYDLYCRWFGMLQKTATPLSAIVYVHTLPDLCSDRITQRCRDGEDGIPLAYLSNLDKYQRDWIDHTSVPTVRTLSDHVHLVEAFVDQLVADATSTSTSTGTSTKTDTAADADAAAEVGAKV